MKNRQLILLTVGILLFAVAFVIGRVSAPHTQSTSSDEPDDSSSAPARISDRSPSGSFSGPNKSRPTTRATSPGSRMESPPDEMLRILLNSDPLARTQSWLDFVNTLDASQFESVVAELRAKGLQTSNMAEYEMLLTAWAKADPLSALEYASENTGSPFARNTILATWAASDPEGAIAWARANHSGDDANPWMVGVIRGLAAYDASHAADLMNEMPYSSERGEALSAIVPHILADGPEAAKAWVLDIDDPQLRDGAIRRISEDLARLDPQSTAEWLQENPGDGARRSMDDVMEIWVEQDLKSATSYYENLPAGELRSSALRGITNQMATTDPFAAADFLDANAEYADDNVYRQFAWHSFRQAPDLALNYIGQIQDTREQSGMYRRMISHWVRRDYDSASNWIQTAQLPDNIIRYAEERMAEEQQRQN